MTPRHESRDSTDDTDDGLDRLQERIGYRFDAIGLLRQALVHRSWAAEHDGPPTNERIEFLGDAVLGLAVADLCYRRFPGLSEGDLTGLRKVVVNASALADVARTIELGSAIRLGKGESDGGGADKPSILSDSLEAVIGAVYLDGGFEAALGLVDRLFGPLLGPAANNLSRFDQKSALQEIAARLGWERPTYTVSSTGPDHAKTFRAEVAVGDISVEGVGRSKKSAEQAAAHHAVTTAVADHPDLGPEFGSDG